MKATIPARKLKTQEAQTVVTAAAATPAEVTLVVATPEAVEDPMGDKVMAGGTQRMTKGYRS
jgi:hypothetical protein